MSKPEHERPRLSCGCEYANASNVCLAPSDSKCPIESKRDRLKAWNDELERISNERSKTIDRILSERNRLEERVKELEEQVGDLLAQHTTKS